MSTLADKVDAYLRQWHNPVLLQAIFRTADPQAIEQMVNAFCLSKLGSPIVETLFFEVSQGAVFGVYLRDGRRIVIKTHNPRRSIDFLNAVVRVQHYLVERGYPCPRPLLEPQPLGDGYAVVEELIDEGIYTDAHNPVIRRSLAEMLAWLLKLAGNPESIAGLLPSALDLRLPPDVLWPIPHNAIFDFEATAAGAEWIDDLARKAKEVRMYGAGQVVIGHTDWSVKHFRYVNGKVRVIYDWDSLALEKEPVIVGGAAVGFTYTEVLNVPPFPTREESRAFVAEYEVARGRPFTSEERRTLAATATYGLCYCARCEHSLQPDAREYPLGSCRALLAQYKDELLSFEE